MSCILYNYVKIYLHMSGFRFMRFTREFLISALLARLFGGAAVHAAEFEVLDRFSVDGYTVLRGSADIPGGSFSVGGSTLVVKSGKVGIGTAGPIASLEIVSTDTVSTAFKVQTGSITGTEVVISTAGKVGIGTTNPGANLEVAGDIKLGYSALVCASNIAGTLRWYVGHISVCNGTDWRQLDNQPPPTVVSLIPGSGINSGGTAITISGSGFNLGLAVLIGGTAATVTTVAGSQITATTPPGSAGEKVVEIVNPDGQNCRTTFAYNPPPTIETVTPVSGPQGTVITITGTGFLSGVGLAVDVGGVSATGITWNSATQITATTPASTTSVAKDVKVTHPETGSATKSAGFTYRVYATGGTVTTAVAGYRIHTFLSNSTFEVATGGTVEYLVVGGGGSGGDDISGGGGGGGFLTGTTSVTVQSYTITIGAGGAATTGTESTGLGNNGNPSSFNSITALGGGAGGGEGQSTGATGASGGGGGYSAGSGGSGTQGYGGGNCVGGVAGGGGGAGGAGTNGATPNGGKGGPGLLSTIDGNSYYYAGGGGGSGWTVTDYGGNGGTGGGGGAGGVNQTYKNPGSGNTQGRNNGLNGNIGANGKGGNAGANTGGGGGGAGETNTGYQSTSGAGGSGIVIIRYQN